MSSDALRPDGRQKGPPADKRESLEQQGYVLLSQRVPAKEPTSELCRSSACPLSVPHAAIAMRLPGRLFWFTDESAGLAGSQRRRNMARGFGRVSGCKSSRLGRRSCLSGISCSGTGTPAPNRVVPSLRAGPTALSGARTSGQPASQTPSRNWPCDRRWPFLMRRPASLKAAVCGQPEPGQSEPAIPEHIQAGPHCTARAPVLNHSTASAATRQLLPRAAPDPFASAQTQEALLRSRHLRTVYNLSRPSGQPTCRHVLSPEPQQALLSSKVDHQSCSS